jgi:hypothetical protein
MLTKKKEVHNIADKKSISLWQKLHFAFYYFAVGSSSQEKYESIAQQPRDAGVHIRS